MSQSPFKFLDSYTKDDREIFFGREREVEELYHRVFEGKIMLVYGVSGTGKSSLIHCGLANKFNEADWLPVNVRRAGDMVRSMAFAIGQASITPVEGEIATPAQFKKAVRSLYLDHYKPIFFVFDQFEELFIFGNKDEKKAFIQIVKSLTESDLQCRFMFVLREEYLAGITEFERVIPTILANRVRIERMTLANAKQVIEGPCKVFNIEVEEGFSDEMLEKLSPGSAEVELTYLQVYLDKVYRTASTVIASEGRAKQSKRSQSDKEEIASQRTFAMTFSQKILGELGDVKDLLGSFLDEQIELLPDPDSALAVLKSFVSVKGTKRQMSPEEVQDYAQTLGKQLNESALQELLQTLILLRILRDKDQNNRYELRHDALATKIYEKITLVEKELLEIRQLIENSYSSWEKRGVLMSAEDLGYIAPYENRLFLSKNFEEFIEKSKYALVKAKKRRRTIAFAAMAALLVVFAGFTWWAMREKQKANEAGIIQLESILKLNESFEKVKITQAKRKTELYDRFQMGYMVNPHKVSPFREKAQIIQKASYELIDFISSLQHEMISRAEQISIDSSKMAQLSSIKKLGDIETSSKILFDEIDYCGLSNVASLKNQINEFKNIVYSQIDRKDWDKISFNLDPNKTLINSKGDSLSWEDANFRETILAGAITNLNNLITEINYIEIDVVNYIYDLITAEDFNIDAISVKVIPKNSVVFKGSSFDAEVMLSAYNTKQNMEAYVLNNREEITTEDYVNTSSMNPFISNKGIINIKVPSKEIGINRYAGFIKIKRQDGNHLHYPFKGEFLSIIPNVSIYLTKMNLMYVGIENIFGISIPGVPPKDISASVNNGNIRFDGYYFIVIPEKTGLIEISIYANIDNTKRAMGSMVYRVKGIPNPIPSVGDNKGGEITLSELMNHEGISINVPDFDWELTFLVKNFTLMAVDATGKFISENAYGSKFSEKQKKIIKQLKPEQYLFIKDIIVIGPQNEQKLNDMIFKIIN